MSLTKGRLVVALIVLLLFLFWGFSTWGQASESEQAKEISLLIIDETKTFQQSIRIELLAGNIKEIGFFDLEAKIVDVKSSYEKPLGVNTTDKKYDLILLFPKGLDDGSIREVWILSVPINYQMEPLVKEGIRTLSSMIEKIFQAEAVNVSESLFPALLSGVLLQDGWISN